MMESFPYLACLALIGAVLGGSGFGRALLNIRATGLAFNY